ncbi:MAG: HDIG domain-containing protein [Gemmatimonadaceae bacterium]|nr:HDIG domain-containing protein [Gemmatimonadaceae bacterium]MCW5827260.1 HDIG domain-containing protein [Gemmatimonadaceae bacterium]
MSDSALPARADALALMEAWTASDSLRKHMLAVEGAMLAYARHFGEDEQAWGLTGLLHDFDYERYPNEAHAADAEHPSEGVRHLRSLGYPEPILQAILGHARYTGVARETRMAKALFAVDELCGLITAAALVRPSRSVLDLEASSVKKRMKDKAFARGVSRADVTEGAAELGVPLEEHIAFVIQALRDRAALLGLEGTAAQGGGAGV